MGDWKQVLAESFDGQDESLPPLLVELEAGAERARASLSEGGLAFTDASDSFEPDLSIRLSEHSLEDVLLGSPDPVAAFRDAKVAAGEGWTAALPAAEGEMVSAEDFERIPGASFRGVLLVTSTMFGDVCRFETWEDGQLAGSDTIAPSRFEEIEAELRFTCTLAQLAALRRGEIHPPDAFADGAILKCDWPYMTVFVERMQHRAFSDAYAAAPALDAQIAWGKLVCGPAYSEAATRARGGQPSPA